MRKSSLLIGLVLALSSLAAPSFAGVLEIPLLDGFDYFGSQIETIQVFHDGTTAYSAFGIYDTGASVITYSYTDRQWSELLSPDGGIKIEVVGGAQADGIGGSLIGDVSKAGAVMADGLHAVGNLFDVFSGLAFEYNATLAVPGVQMFVGASPGSTALPTITGTPIHFPTTAHPNGRAAKINMKGYELDFGDLFEGDPLFEGLVFQLPDVSFVSSHTDDAKITAGADTTDVVRIPLALLGDDNYGTNPGDTITYAPNPVQNAVKLEHNASVVNGKTFLFDTGAQLSIISSEIAIALGLDLDDSTREIEVQGAAGATVLVPGYTIDALELPCDENGDGLPDEGNALRFVDVPVYVLDMGFGIDGILGMNLFNPAAEMLYDPFANGGPSLWVTFDQTREPSGSLSEDAEALLLSGPYAALVGMLGPGAIPHLPRFDLEPAAIPEPSTLLLLALGTVAMLIVRRRGS